MGKKEVTMFEMVLSAVWSGDPDSGISRISMEKHILEKNKVGYHPFGNTGIKKKLYKREKDELAKVIDEGIESGKISLDGGIYKIAK